MTELFYAHSKDNEPPEKVMTSKALPSFITVANKHMNFG
jgi:hypothetical protein